MWSGVYAIDMIAMNINNFPNGLIGSSGISPPMGLSNKEFVSSLSLKHRKSTFSPKLRNDSLHRKTYGPSAQTRAVVGSSDGMAIIISGKE